MKLKISIPIILTSLLLTAFLFTNTSCSSKAYTADQKVSYNKSKRIKAYKRNSSRNSFNHSTPVRKKYVIKR